MDDKFKIFELEMQFFTFTDLSLARGRRGLVLYGHMSSAILISFRHRGSKDVKSLSIKNTISIATVFFHICIHIEKKSKKINNPRRDTVAIVSTIGTSILIPK